MAGPEDEATTRRLLAKLPEAKPPEAQTPSAVSSVAKAFDRSGGLILWLSGAGMVALAYGEDHGIRALDAGVPCVRVERIVQRVGQRADREDVGDVPQQTPRSCRC
jgi:hypothetical protein